MCCSYTSFFYYTEKQPKMIPGITTLKVKRLSEHAKLPMRASDHAAGYDLFAAADYLIVAQGKELVKTDIAVAIPPGYYGRIAPRSSLALKSHIDVGAGVIDEDYRGPIGVVLFNLGSMSFKGMCLCLKQKQKKRIPHFSR